MDYDGSSYLSYGNVLFDPSCASTTVQVNIKASKTDPFRKGVATLIGRTNNDLCPVSASAAYITIRGSNEGPFFLLQYQAPLTREHFVKMTRDKLTAAGVDASHYSGHSSRIGAATMASAYEVEDSLIQTLGHWKSAAYLLYVRVPGRFIHTFSEINTGLQYSVSVIMSINYI